MKNPSPLLAALLLGIGTTTQAATFTVTTTADSGAGSLRVALTSADAVAGPHTIVFHIPNTDPNLVAGVFVITPTNALPILFTSGGITIDGSSQTAFGGDTNPLGPEISLNGNNAVGGLFLGNNNRLINLNIRNFLGYGLTMTGGTNNTVRGCYIGTDPTGQIAQPNAGAGIDCAGSRNTFGGTSPSDRNVICGNSNDGITLRSTAGNNIIQGNYFGTDATGTKAISGSADGIECLGPNNLIGGNTPAARNIFAGHINAAGVRLAFGTVTGTIVRGNYFGTDVTGTNVLANREGIDIVNGANGTIIDSNLITGNLRAGIRINTNTLSGVAPTNNLVTGNSIFNNGNPNQSYLGISFAEISTTPTPNDPCDADDGNQHLQNYPIISNATTVPGGVRIQGTLNSVASQSYRIEFFANDECDPTGYGEGQYYLGFTNVTTTGGCTATIDVTLAAIIQSPVNLTATATDPDNNTSEFGPCLQFFPNPIQCDLDSGTALVITNTPHTLTSTVTSNGLPRVGVTVYFNITSGPNAGTTGTDVTDANGQATFQFTSPDATGTDAISATGRVGNVDIQCDATVQWVTGFADLAITKVGLPDPVVLNTSNLTYTIIVTNQGPDTPQSATVTDSLPASLTFVSATPSQGNCVNNSGTVTCNLGALANGQSASITLIATPTGAGKITNTVAVSSEHVDLQTADNTATRVITAVPAGTDLTAELDATFGTCTNTSKGTLCPVNAELLLRNSGVVYGDAVVTLTNTCKTTTIPATCKLRGILTVNELDLTGLADHSLQFYLSDDEILGPGDFYMKGIRLSKALSSFVKGKAIKLSLKLPKGVDLTGKHIIAKIDADNNVAETDETNNTSASPAIPALP